MTYKEALSKFLLSWETLITEDRNQLKLKIGMANYSIGINFQIKYGRKYDKVIVDNSVYGFIDKSNGDILMASSWVAPAKNGARGNIFSDNPLNAVTAYGVKYKK